MADGDRSHRISGPGSLLWIYGSGLFQAEGAFIKQLFNNFLREGVSARTFRPAFLRAPLETVPPGLEAARAIQSSVMSAKYH